MIKVNNLISEQKCRFVLKPKSAHWQKLIISKSTVLVILFLLISITSQAQSHKQELMDNLLLREPSWVEQLCDDSMASVNFYELDEKVQKYEKSFKNENRQNEINAGYLAEENEDIYLLKYKRWLQKVRPYILPNGSIDVHSYQNPPIELVTKSNIVPYKKKVRGASSPWNLLGPTETVWRKENWNTQPVAPWQVNIYAVAMAASNTNILYAAPETGGIFKTIDKGLNWNLVLDQPWATATFETIDIDPTNANIVYAGRNNMIRKSVDGGITWNTKTLASSYINTIKVKPSNPLHVFATSSNGLFISLDSGATWTKHLSLTSTCYDIVFNPINNNSIIVMAKSGTAIIAYISIDGGVTFNATTGWSGKDINQADGARVTASAADSNILYAVVLGGGTSPYKPYIFKSTNGGFNWDTTCTGILSGLTGSTATPLGMSNGQGYYDLDILANPNNANEVIVATTTAYKSTNGGLTFSAVGGYHGSFPIHPDVQEMIATGGETWIATDGGLTFSNDFFTVNSSGRFKGIFGSDNWGFAQGWNEDIVGGGRYHNGNTVMYEGYPAGLALRMGGGEAPTGYYMMGKERSIAFSDLGNVSYSVPYTYNGISKTAPFTKFPNEDGYGWDASEVLFHPTCYNIIYSGSGNMLWKSVDGGGSWISLHTFPNRVKKYQVCRSNPDIIYVAATNSFWKSIDAGATWSQLTMPASTTISQMKIEVSYTNPNLIWIASPNNSNNNKVFKSINGGVSWINLTTPTINNYKFDNMVLQQGTLGGIYLLAGGGNVFYRNDTMSNWVAFNNNLPKGYGPLKTIPFYRDGKLRTAGNRGYWEVEFYEPSEPIVQPTVDKLVSNCAKDTFYFDDYSVLQHSTATWTWSFPGATYVSSTSVRNPKVTYPGVGSYNVTLTITQGAVSKSITINNMVSIATNLCVPDTIPGKALAINAQDNFAYTNVVDIPSTKRFTMMAWVKGKGAQADYAGLLSMQTSNGSVHLNLRDYNADSAQIGYHHPNGQWWFSSGLYLKPNVWTHVALVVDSNKIVVYKDGIGAQHNRTIANATIGPKFEVGTMISREYDRTFNGLIDEVVVLDTALTANQIRQMMHLTKENPNYVASQHNAHIVSYYQFNEPANAPSYDKIRTNHLSLAGTAINKDTISSAPIGGGVSETINVAAGGIKNFTGPGVELTFPTSGTLPNGDIYVSRINIPSDELCNPSVLPSSPNSYYIINNYGTNKTFAPLNSIKFENVQGTFTGMNPNNIGLFKRFSNSHGATWSNPIDMADNLVDVSGIGSVTFNTGLNLNSFSQFSMSYTGIPLAINNFDFNVKLANTNEALITWHYNKINEVQLFELEYSLDGINFKKIETKVPSQSADYSFVYPTLINGKNFFRLRIINSDNTISYSLIKFLTITNLKEDVIISPNPSIDGWINIKLVDLSSCLNFKVIVINSKGQIIQTNYIQNNSASNYININAPSGQYIVNVILGNGKVFSKKVVIE